LTESLNSFVAHRSEQREIESIVYICIFKFVFNKTNDVANQIEVKVVSKHPKLTTWLGPNSFAIYRTENIEIELIVFIKL